MGNVFGAIFRSALCGCGTIRKYRRLQCRLPAPPPVVDSVYKRILEKLRSELSSDGIQLENHMSGPALVVVVNSSAIASDVRRDVDNAGIKEGPIVLLIIKQTRKKTDSPRVQINDLRDSRIKEACFFLVNIEINNGLHTCSFNNESYNKVLDYLNRQ